MEMPRINGSKATLALILLLFTKEILADSTSLSPPNLTSYQPYLLDSGTMVTPLVCMDNSCFGGASPGLGYFYTHPVGVCPANFTPIVQVTPYKSQQEGIGIASAKRSGFSAVCVYRLAPGANTYTVYITTSALLNDLQGTYSSNTTNANIGFNYNLYCYPGGYAITQIPDPSCDQFSSVTYSGQPFLLDHGFISPNYNQNSGCVSFSAEIYKQCPAGYQPWATYFVINGTTQFQSTGTQPNAIYAWLTSPIGHHGACNFSQGGGSPPETDLQFDLQILATNTGNQQNQPIGCGGPGWNVSGAVVGYNLYCYPTNMSPGYQQITGGIYPKWFDAGNQVLSGGSPPCASQ